MGVILTFNGIHALVISLPILGKVRFLDCDFVWAEREINKRDMQRVAC
jgi:hypothetical protein